MDTKEFTTLKELLVIDGSRKTIQNKYSKLYATSEDYLIMIVAKIGAELYSYSYKPHYSSEKIKIEDLPEFWNNRTLEDAKVYFKENYIKAILERKLESLEIKFFNDICDKYGLSKYPTMRVWYYE